MTSRPLLVLSLIICERAIVRSRLALVTGLKKERPSRNTAPRFHGDRRGSSVRAIYRPVEDGPAVCIQLSTSVD